MRVDIRDGTFIDSFDLKFQLRTLKFKAGFKMLFFFLVFIFFGSKREI